MLAVLWGTVFGLFLGLTPFGGAFIGMAVLIVAGGAAPWEAVTTALTATALCGAVGAGDGARARALDTGIGVWLAIGGAGGVIVGTFLLGHVEARAWAIGFLVVGVAAAIRLWRDDDREWLRAGLFLGVPRMPAGAIRLSRLPLPRLVGLVGAGVAAGVSTGVLGAGSGVIGLASVRRWGGQTRRQGLANVLLATTAIGLVGTAVLWATMPMEQWNRAGLYVLGAVAGFGFARRLAPRFRSAGMARFQAIVVALAAVVVAAHLW